MTLGCSHRTTSAVCPWRHRALTVQLAKTVWACQQLHLHLVMTSHANCNCKCKCSVSKCLYYFGTSSYKIILGMSSQSHRATQWRNVPFLFYRIFDWNCWTYMPRNKYPILSIFSVCLLSNLKIVPVWALLIHREMLRVYENSQGSWKYYSIAIHG